MENYGQALDDAGRPLKAIDWFARTHKTHLPRPAHPHNLVAAVFIIAAAALALNNGYAKAYYRRATAHLALGKFKPALADFRAVAR